LCDRLGMKLGLLIHRRQILPLGLRAWRAGLGSGLCWHVLKGCGLQAHQRPCRDVRGWRYHVAADRTVRSPGSGGLRGGGGRGRHRLLRGRPFQRHRRHLREGCSGRSCWGAGRVARRWSRRLRTGGNNQAGVRCGCRARTFRLAFGHGGWVAPWDCVASGSGIGPLVRCRTRQGPGSGRGAGGARG